jgi:hypothetical protein
MYLCKQIQSKYNKQHLRLIPLMSILILIMLAISACSTTSSAEPETPVPTAIEPGSQKSPASPTPKPKEGSGENRESTEQPTYTNESYGFEFTYADTWALEEEEHAVVLRQDSLILRINYAWATEDIGSGLFGRTGVGAGDFIESGKVNFVDRMIPIQTLEYEGKDKAIFYNGTDLIDVNDLVFMIVLEDLETDYRMLDIPEAAQHEVAAILATFQLFDMIAECEEQGGRWEVLGFSGPGCNLPSSDGGKSCTDIKDCEGLCLADNEDTNAQGDELMGVCSEWQSNFGCHEILEKGRIVEICID